MSKSIAAAGAAACVLGFAALSAPHAAQAADHPDFTGLWRVQAFIPAIKTDKGALPPLRPEAKKIYDQRVADRAAKRDVNDPIDACLPHGAARLMFTPLPDADPAIQRPAGRGPGSQSHHAADLYRPAPRSMTTIPSGWATSSAHWQGRSLVVDTINNDHRTWLDKAGLPHSDDMKVTERLRLGKDGKTMTISFTIDDPKTYTAPWTTVVRYPALAGVTAALKENVCVRDHQDVGGAAEPGVILPRSACAGTWTVCRHARGL